MSKVLFRNNRGSSIVEFAIVFPFVLLITGCMIELIYIAYQYNTAIKAAERGARIAAVSSPVPADFKTTTKAALDASATSSVSAGGRISLASAKWSAVTCTSSTTTNTVPLTVTCTNSYTADVDAFSRIYFGRKPSGSYLCGSSFTIYSAGLCDLFPEIRPNNVSISYIPTGLDYYGNPEGAIPEILVTLSGIQYKSAFLAPLTNLFKSAMPAIKVSIVSEDLSTTYP